jgi:hypothetical protein
MSGPTATIVRTFTDAEGPGSGTVELGPYTIILRPDQYCPKSSSVVLDSVKGYTVVTSFNPGYVALDGKGATIAWGGSTGASQKIYFYVATLDPAP